MARRTKAEAEVTRQQLLKAGLDVFSRLGYADTRLEDVAEEAGVTRGAIYHHFGSKAELYSSLIAETMRRVQPTIQDFEESIHAIQPGVVPSEEPAIQRSLSQERSALATLRRFFIRLTLLVVEDAEYRAVVELMIFKTAVPPELEEGMSQKVEATKQMVSALEQVAARGIAAREIRPELDPPDVALSLLALQNGLVLLWLLAPDLFSLSERAEQIFDLWLHGIAVRP